MLFDLGHTLDITKTNDKKVEGTLMLHFSNPWYFDYGCKYV